jgi:hypothetical protein
MLQALVFAAFVGGCSLHRLGAPGAAAADRASAFDARLAKVCVARTSVLAPNVALSTRDNGRLVGATKGGTHFCYLAEPGLHEITIVAEHPTGLPLQPVERIERTFEAGETYVLRQDVLLLPGVVACHAAFVRLEADALLRRTAHEVLREGPDGAPHEPVVAPAKRRPG